MIAGRTLTDLLDDLLGGGMGQGAEDEIEPGGGPVHALDRLQPGQIERRELRKHLAHLLPGAAIGGEQRELGPGMADQEPHELRAGITGRAEHADLGFLVGRCGHGFAPRDQDDRMRDTAAEDIRIGAAEGSSGVIL